jgi:hypothetical protein
MGNSSADKLRLAPQGNWSLHAQQPKARAAVSEVPLLDHACERFTDGRRNVPSTLSTTGVRSRAPIFRETTLCFAFLVPCLRRHHRLSLRPGPRYPDVDRRGDRERRWRWRTD